MSDAQIPAKDIHCAVVVSAADNDFEELYTLDKTHYGRLLLVFQLSGNVETFRQYAQQTLKAGYQAKTLIVVANNLDQVQAELTKRNLLPSGPSRVAVEGTAFFDEVMAQLTTNTIWAE